MKSTVHQHEDFRRRTEVDEAVEEDDADDEKRNKEDELAVVVDANWAQTQMTAYQRTSNVRTAIPDPPAMMSNAHASLAHKTARTGSGDHASQRSGCRRGSASTESAVA
jgi:hypothetical protein